MLTTFYPPFTFGGDQDRGRAAGRGARPGRTCHRRPRRGRLPGAERTGGPRQSRARRRHRRAPTERPRRLSPFLAQQTGRPVLQRRGIEAVLRRGFDVVNFHNVSLLGGPGLLNLGSAARSTSPTSAPARLPDPRPLATRPGAVPGASIAHCTLRHRRHLNLWRYTGSLERRLDEVDAFVALSEFSRRKHAEFGFSQPMELLPYCLPDEAPRLRRRSASPAPLRALRGTARAAQGLDDVVATGSALTWCP